MINISNIFSIKNDSEFEGLALEIFRIQSETIPVYREFIGHLKIDPGKVNSLKEIPFLPVEFFKSHQIIPADSQAEIVFRSSGTTGLPSLHFVADKSIYETSLKRGFELFYQNREKYCILALLPSYLERTGSSLVYMADKLISDSKDPDSGFYLSNTGKLMELLRRKNEADTPTILLGVSFALADLALNHHENLSNIIFIETGGMKGRKKEMVREELHKLIKENFNLSEVHSEYGMTEILSQAYSKSGGVFYCPPWMKILIRDSYDPFRILNEEKTGSINIIDLANVYSCSFVATSDLGRLHPYGGFEVLGRIDNSDIRGCNLLVME